MTRSPLEILLIDDDEDDFVNLRDLLAEIEGPGYRLTWRANYQDGLGALLEQPFDACLLDYRLGQHTGLELMEKARLHGSNCPMILLTGQGDFELDIKAMESGAADYLVKDQITAPLLERSLRYAMKHALDMRALSAQKENFQTLFNSTFEGVVVYQMGKIVDANTAAGRIFGVEPSGLNNSALLDLIRPDFRAELERQLSAGRDLAMEAVALKKSGQEIFVALQSRTINLKGHWVSLIAIQDLTQRKLMESQILQQDRLASLGLLASSLAHEIGTPLGVIRGRAEMLAKSADEKTRSTMELIIGQIDRIAKLVNSLLHLARGQASASTTDVNLMSVLSDVLNLLSHELKRNSVELDLNIPADLVVWAEAGPLGQVFLNLAVNALHAIEAVTETGRPRRISICAEDLRDEVRIHVADTGCGITEQNLPRLFQPFFTTKGIGRGTGLGLATSYKLIASWGGTIQASSRVDQGTTFTIGLKSPAHARPLPTS